MDTRLIFNRIKNIISQPDKEWDVIEQDSNGFMYHVKSFAMPCIIALSLAKFINTAFIQNGFMIWNALLFTIIDLVSYVGGLYLASNLISYIGPSFLAESEKTRTFKYIIYASTPIYLATFVTNLVDSLLFMKLFYAYAIYLLWIGADRMMKVPEKHKLVFIIIVIVLIFGTEEAIRHILMSILPVSVPTVG